MDSRDRAALTRTLQAIYREIGAMGDRVYRRVLPGGRLPAHNGGTGTSQGAEPPLGNPASDGQVLASTTAGVRSWVDNGGGGVPRPFAYLLDAAGNFLVDADGAYLFEYIDTPDSGGTSLTIAEIDGTPSGTPSTLQFPNGTVTDEGGGVYRYTPAGGGGTPNRDYFARLSALLDPGAIEVLLSGTFTYTVGSSATKYVLGSFNVTVGGTGKRLEVRHSETPLALHDVTMVGAGSDALAVTLDPSLPVDTDPEATYYARLLAIDDLPTKVISASGDQAHATLLAGPYGVIITRMTIFNLTWMGAGLPNDSELGDAGSTDYMRWDSPHRSPMNKLLCEIANGYAGGVGANIGSVAYVILPSTWSKVPDPLTYVFRDDFMAASLDTTTNWDRLQSTAGNVEIDTRFQWLKLNGNNTFYANFLRSKIGHLRSAARTLLVDVYPGITGETDIPNLAIGWFKAGATDTTILDAALVFTDSSGKKLVIYEAGGTSRGNVGSGWSFGYVYRIRITLRTGGGADYAIQGGPEYAPLGGATWSTLTGSSTGGTTATLYPGAGMYASGVDTYISDMRVY